MDARTLLGLGLCVMLSGCLDSKNPLSDATDAKPDERLVGVWQSGEVSYFIGHAGKAFPKGVMRVVEVTHNQADVERPVECLAYPTVLGNKTYLNMVIDEEQIKQVDEKGWNAAAVEAYTFLKYQLDGDRLVLWPMDEKAKEQAIKDGKIKGTIAADNVATFTDSSENVARFISKADDRLWEAKESVRLEQTTAYQRKIERFLQAGNPPAPRPPLRPLGSSLMVDKNGIIWDNGRPVGIWGIEGSIMRPEEPSIR